MSLKNRSFLKLLDYTPAEIEQLLGSCRGPQGQEKGRHPA